MARSGVNREAYGNLAQELQNHERNLRGSIQDALQQAAEAGADEMRHTIETTGTGWVGRGPRATPTGRIDYGNMLDDVTTGPVRRHPKGSKASFGWIKNEEDYYAFQDMGTRQIEGMHAMASGMYVARETLIRVLSSYKRRRPR